MKLPKLTLGDILAAAIKNVASSSLRTPAADETDDLQKQLDNARQEVQKALGEWRSYRNPYYEKAWVEAVEKVHRLEAKIPMEAEIPKRKTTSQG